MAKKKTAAKKSAKPKTAAGRKKAAKVGLTMGNSKADPNQKEFVGMEQPKIPMIESSVKRMLEIKKEQAALKEEKEELRIKVSGLLEKNDLEGYKCLGKRVYLVPGSPVLKIATVKDK